MYYTNIFFIFFVFYLIVLATFFFKKKKHLKNAQITFMHCLLHMPFFFFCLHFNPVPALLYYICLMNASTVCMYVSQLILDLSLIRLWKCSVVDNSVIFEYRFLFTKNLPSHHQLKTFKEKTKQALCDQSITTFNKHLFSLKGSAILIPTKNVQKRNKTLKCRPKVDDI